jgi:predicted transcriptional regulator of viral defense system
MLARDPQAVNEIRARHDLTFTGHRNVTGVDDRRLRAAAQRGVLTRLHRGVYVETAVWKDLSRDERHRLFVAAALDAGRPDLVASHESAAALWDIPLVGAPPAEVHVATAVDAGSRREHGFRKHAMVLPDRHVSSVGGLTATTPERTVVDLALTLPFAEAVVVADWALRSGISRERLDQVLEEARPTYHRRRAEVVLRFADGRAESPGESLSRAYMRLLGLPAPDLQTRFSDWRGLIGAVDFYWAEANLIGEFDGRVKYTDQRMLGGRTATDVVVAEKRREDRLRAKGQGVARWTWLDLATPATLGRVLAQAGLGPHR